MTPHEPAVGCSITGMNLTFAINTGANVALFKSGSVVATPGALQFCEAHKINPLSLLKRHIAGDWGDLDAADTAANQHAVQHDLRIFSSYKIGGGKVWVITEADRSSTCILLPDEY
jgi:hypothetical protein